MNEWVPGVLVASPFILVGLHFAWRGVYLRAVPINVQIAGLIVVACAVTLGVVGAIYAADTLIALAGFAKNACCDLERLRVSLGESPWFVAFELVSVLASVLVPFGLVLLGIGLLRVRSWAFAVTVGVLILCLLLMLGPVAFGNGVEIRQLALGVAIAGIVLMLVVNPSSRQAFAEAREQEATPS